MTQTRAARVPALDGVRGLAIGAVVAFHTAGGHHARGGWLGVDVFFVLSGFLITGLLLTEREQTGRMAVGAFYLRRARRLYPALLGAVLLGLVVVRLGDARAKPYPEHVAYALTYLQDFATLRHWGRGQGLLSHTWSLAVEEHFYLLWPLALVLVAARGRRVVGLVALTAAVAGFAVMQLAYAPGHEKVLPSVYYRPDARSAALLVGCAAACVRGVRWQRLATPALVALVVVLLASPRPEGRLAYAVAMPLVWVTTATLLIALTAGDRSVAGRLLARRPVAYVGSISYGLYLYHPLVGAVVLRQGIPPAATAALTVGVATAIAAASYHLVEQPVLRLGRRRGATAEPSVTQVTPNPHPGPATPSRPPVVTSGV